jgi:exodeoxyribonuclease V gamma subunit
MELIRSNRTEELADALLSIVRDEPLPPLSQELIVVQSRGMERWLSLRLAQGLGIWANPAFPFPRAAIELLLQELGPDDAEAARAYAPQRLKWVLADLLTEGGIPALERYLGQTPDADRVLRLAGKLGELFDHYVIYRPDVLDQWRRGSEPEDWQATLWRRLDERLGPHDLASRIHSVMPKLARPAGTLSLRFERLHLFAVETLPPLFLSFFAAVSRHIPTKLYLLEPSQEYTAGVEPAQLSLPVIPGEEASSSSDGHPLLSSLGALSREFQDMLLEGVLVERETDRFVTPVGDSLLSRTQADILAFNPPNEGPKPIVDANDASISIHECTSPFRETQVLHELIRAALEDDPGLRPEDIVVMVPDLDSYAPAFEAVFGAEQALPIPYDVHRATSPHGVDLFGDALTILSALGSRFSMLDMLKLLEAQSLREAYRFSQSEQARLAELLRDAGVRWGIDGEHRIELGFPADATHSWRAGLSRLLLGFCMPPDDPRVFGGLMPRGAPSLGDAELIGRLSDFCELLFRFRSEAKGPLPAPLWAQRCDKLLRSLLRDDDDCAEAARSLRDALQDILEGAERAGFTAPVSLETVRQELARRLARASANNGFLRRGVTLTELVPLRSVPFRIVCLAGMSEERFPRADDRPGYDLTRRRQRRGDRNKRRDDRHSFLQSLLCARDRLLITYSPRLPPRHGRAAPSPIVLELREAAARYYAREEGEPIEIARHPLQAFDARYFDGTGPLRSFSEHNAALCQALVEPKPERSPVVLSAQSTEPVTQLSPAELRRWIWHPMREFVQRRLDTRLERSELYEPSRPLTDIEPLQRFIVGERALGLSRAHVSLTEHLAASPEFPDGSWGLLQREKLQREIESMQAEHRRLKSPSSAQETLVAIRLGELRLEGRLHGVQQTERLLTRFCKPGRAPELEVWIEHLLLNAGPADLPKRTVLVLRGQEALAGQASVVRFCPVPDALEKLHALAELCLASQSEPSPLYPIVSWELAQRALQGKDLEYGFRQLGDALFKSAGSHDPYLALGWNPKQLNDPDWREHCLAAAQAVYGPLIEHRSAS